MHHASLFSSNGMHTTGFRTGFRKTGHGTELWVHFIGVLAWMVHTWMDALCFADTYLLVTEYYKNFKFKMNWTGPTYLLPQGGGRGHDNKIRIDD